MSELELICAGSKFRVSMTNAVAKAFRKVSAQERARIQKWMGFFAEDGDSFLDTTKFKHEGKFPTGDKSGREVAVYAFKAWQVRVCGGFVDGNHFVATEIDVSKKQDKADRDLLERAAKKLWTFMAGEQR